MLGAIGVFYGEYCFSEAYQQNKYLTLQHGVIEGMIVMSKSYMQVWKQVDPIETHCERPLRRPVQASKIGGTATEFQQQISVLLQAWSLQQVAAYLISSKTRLPSQERTLYPTRRNVGEAILTSTIGNCLTVSMMHDSVQLSKLYAASWTCPLDATKSCACLAYQLDMLNCRLQQEAAAKEQERLGISQEGRDGVPDAANPASHLSEFRSSFNQLLPGS